MILNCDSSLVELIFYNFIKIFCSKVHHSRGYQAFFKKISCLNSAFVLISCSRQHTVANQRGKISRDRKYSKLIGCSAACVHFFYCENKENVYLQNRVISTQNEHTNYSSHFKYKICLKIFCLTFF